MKKSLALVALAILLALAGCATPVAVAGTEPPATPSPTVEPTPTAEPTPTPAPTEAPVAENTVTTGSFEGSTYNNEYFGLSFTVPNDWTIATKEQMQQIFNAGAELVGSDNKELEKTMKLAGQRTLYLAYASKFPLGTEPSNSNINVVCENLAIAGAGSFTSKDYADATVEMLKKSLEGCVISDPESVKFGDVDAIVYDLSFTLQGAEIKQAQLCAVRNGYGIVFTMTYFSDDQMAELQQVAGTIKFE